MWTVKKKTTQIVWTTWSSRAEGRPESASNIVLSFPPPPPEEGYKRGKQILRKNFGSPHLVTQAFLDKVVSGPPMRTPDPDYSSLVLWYRDVSSWINAIKTQKQLWFNWHAEQNRSTNLPTCLPTYLWSKWAERANRLYEPKLVLSSRT